MEKYKVIVSRYQVKEIYVGAPDAVAAVRLAKEMADANEIEFSERDTDFIDFETLDNCITIQSTKSYHTEE